MIRKLQKRFVAVAMASVFLVLTVLIGLINVMNYRTMLSEADETLTIIANNNGIFPSMLDFPDGELPEGFTPGELPEGFTPGELPEGFASDGSFSDGRNPQNNRGGWKQREQSAELPFQTRYFTVTFDEAGEVAASNLDNIAALNESEAQALAKTVYALRREKGLTEGYRYRRAAVSDGTMLIFLSCVRELTSFRSSLVLSIGISAGGMLAVFLLIVLLSRRFVGPVAESYAKQKRFITDAGHELKTPLTIINADADVLETELSERSEWLDDIRTQTQRLSALTNDLVYLSRMEEDVPIQPIVFPLSDVVAETAQSFATIARVQNKTFTVDVQPSLEMNGDEKAIRKLISVLLDNAQKYSPEGGSIRVVLRREGKQLHFLVQNTAEGVQKGSADRLFDRFYRADPSRSAGGFGLGLSVAKAVTEAHKGRIHAFSEDGASLTVEAVFPTA